MKKVLLLGVLFIFLLTTYAQASVCINEIMAKNTAFPEFADEFGELSDWIELYNKGDEAINLEGYYLSDDVSEPTLWKFPYCIIEPKSTIIIYANDKNQVTYNGIHTNFKISGDETIVLTAPDGITTIDIINLSNLEDDYTYARRFDGESPFEKYTNPSFNKPNSQGGVRINVFGEYIKSEVPARIIDGTAMLPLRFVFDAINAQVIWDGETRTITGSLNGINIKLTVDSDIAYINDVETTLVQKPVIIDGRTLVPMRFIAEAFNFDVLWNEFNRTVFIRRGGFN